MSWVLTVAVCSWELLTAQMQNGILYPYWMLIPTVVLAAFAGVANLLLFVFSAHSCWHRNQGQWYLAASLVVPVAIGVVTL